MTGRIIIVRCKRPVLLSYSIATLNFPWHWRLTLTLLDFTTSLFTFASTEDSHYCSSQSSVLPLFLFSFLQTISLEYPSSSLLTILSRFVVKTSRLFCQLLFLILVKLFLDYTVYYNTNHLTLKLDQEITLQYLHFFNLVSAPVFFTYKFVLHTVFKQDTQLHHRVSCLSPVINPRLSFLEGFNLLLSTRHSSRQIPLPFNFTVISASPQSSFLVHPVQFSAFLSLARRLHNPKYSTY